MIKTTDCTREIKLFRKIGFSSPNSAYLCISSQKNLNFKFRTFPKKYLKEIIHFESVTIYKSLCFPFGILTLLIDGLEKIISVHNLDRNALTSIALLLAITA